jgi:hypothetical protein
MQQLRVSHPANTAHAPPKPAQQQQQQQPMPERPAPTAAAADDNDSERHASVQELPDVTSAIQAVLLSLECHSIDLGTCLSELLSDWLRA